MKNKFVLPRRALLKGLGGVTLGLPLLEIMLDSDRALALGTNPPRYIVVFNGQSITRDALKQALASRRTAFADILVTVDDQVAEGEKVSTRRTWRATHRGAVSRCCRHRQASDLDPD